MVEFVAIMEYLMGRYRPTPLQPSAGDAAFPACQQFPHMGEAGLATLIMIPLVTDFVAPEGERDNWIARWARECVDRRLWLVRRQLAGVSYMAGDRFKAAGMSVTYALNLGANHAGFVLSDAEQAYLARTTGRDPYKRGIERSNEGISIQTRDKFRPPATLRQSGCLEKTTIKSVHVPNWHAEILEKQPAVFTQHCPDKIRVLVVFIILGTITYATQ